MKFNLDNLSSYQKELDQKIAEVHNLKPSETVIERVLAFMVELGELANETRCFKYWSFKSASERSIVLEEYVDGIHFLISLCNGLDMKIIFKAVESKESLTKQFIDIFVLAGQLRLKFNEENLRVLFEHYLALGISLGFNEEDIINGYLKKNEKNHQRQEQNY